VPSSVSHRSVRYPVCLMTDPWLIILVGIYVFIAIKSKPDRPIVLAVFVYVGLSVAALTGHLPDWLFWPVAALWFGPAAFLLGGMLVVAMLNLVRPDLHTREHRDEHGGVLPRHPCWRCIAAEPIARPH
jgi:hypothetical protein